ncbi:MAG: PIN domain-containing protein [Chloroflexota bacterium]
MGRPAPARPLVLDAGALIGFDDRDRRAVVLIQRARELGAPIIVPAGALAQVWRNGARQADLARLIRARDVDVVDLSASLAKATGELCGRRGTSDVVDASVVIIARQVRGVVATTDSADLRHLDPGLPMVAL